MFSLGRTMENKKSLDYLLFFLNSLPAMYAPTTIRIALITQKYVASGCGCSLIRAVYTTNAIPQRLTTTPPTTSDRFISRSPQNLIFIVLNYFFFFPIALVRIISLFSVWEVISNLKTSNYSMFFFFARLIVNNVPPNAKKVIPTIPIIAGIPISYIVVVVGQSSLIRYPKISNSAEMIMSSIPSIINTFFVSIFYSPLIITIIIAEKIMSSIPIINNFFFGSISYSLSNIINILIPIRLSSCILYKMKESLFFHLISNNNYRFWRSPLIENYR